MNKKQAAKFGYAVYLLTKHNLKCQEKIWTKKSISS